MCSSTCRGTSDTGLEGISVDEFDIDRAGRHAGTLYGRAIYAAESCTKADEYTFRRALALCYSVFSS